MLLGDTVLADARALIATATAEQGGAVLEGQIAALTRLVEVATEMLLSQGVVKRDDEKGIRSLREGLEEVFRTGRTKGFAAALELFYERR